MSEQQPEEETTGSTESTDPSGATDSDTSSESGGSSESSGSSESNASSEPKGEGEPGEISDEDLPEDLQPTEENPLARHPDQTGDDEDKIGADTDREPETAPMTEDEGEYGEKSD